MKALLIAASLLALTSSAQAYRGHQYPMMQYHHSSYYVPGCKFWPCVSNDARVLTVPQDMKFNENPNWGRDERGILCRSCFDASK